MLREERLFSQYVPYQTKGQLRRKIYTFDNLHSQVVHFLQFASSIMVKFLGVVRNDAEANSWVRLFNWWMLNFSDVRVQGLQFSYT